MSMVSIALAIALSYFPAIAAGLFLPERFQLAARYAAAGIAATAVGMYLVIGTSGHEVYLIYAALWTFTFVMAVHLIQSGHRERDHRRRMRQMWAEHEERMDVYRNRIDEIARRWQR